MRTSTPDRFAVILPAGGSSSRFGSNKLLACLDGRTVLERGIAAFLPLASRVLVAHPAVSVPEFDAEVRRLRAVFGAAVEFIGVGGASRAHTVRNALTHVEEEWVAIHDAARPLVSRGLIDRVLSAAKAHGAAAPAMPVTLTIKAAGTTLPTPVERTVPRANLWAMQTPQVMRRADLVTAFEQCSIPLEQVTDDVQLLELSRLPVMLVEGEERNLKLTTPLDLRLAELMMRERREAIRAGD